MIEGDIPNYHVAAICTKMPQVRVKFRRLILSIVVLVIVYCVAKRLYYINPFSELDIPSLFMLSRSWKVGNHVTVTITRTNNSPEVRVRNDKGKITNIGTLGVDIHPASRGSESRSLMYDGLHYTWNSSLELRVKEAPAEAWEAADGRAATGSRVACYEVFWTTNSCQTPLRDCYSLRHGHWYGGFEYDHQSWPMNDIQQPLQAYVTSYFSSGVVNGYGAVIERLFVSSNGFGIFVYPEVPLFLSFNEKGSQTMCLVAKCADFPYSRNTDNPPFLRYQICQGPDVKLTHQHMTNKHLAKPRDIPNLELFRAPIWSTWAMFKKNVDQTKVLDYARAIRENGFPYSQLEIDDNWTPRKGDLDFNRTRFPDPKGMINQLSELGMRVTVWVHPFFDLDSKAAVEGHSKGYLVTGKDGDAPAVIHWRHPWESAFLLDVTNPDAVSWYLDATRFLQQTYNVTSFKFDYGEATWLTEQHRTKYLLYHPDQYARHYVDMALRADPVLRAQEVRVGFRTQDLPVMTRMLDRLSSWGTKLGLRTLIPTVLTFGIIGYPFVLADMIGGNDKSLKDNPELFIRWLQANTFFPFLQFSTGPWIYDNHIVRICRKFVYLHMNYSDVIISLARESTRTGAPIVRPLWWIAPTDRVTWTIDTQYLLGDNLLVAPVLEEGARSRDIYLPTGSWVDKMRGGNYKGPRWLRGHPAALDELPFFERQQEMGT